MELGFGFEFEIRDIVGIKVGIQRKMKEFHFVGWRFKEVDDQSKK